MHRVKIYKILQGPYTRASFCTLIYDLEYCPYRDNYRDRPMACLPKCMSFCICSSGFRVYDPACYLYCKCRHADWGWILHSLSTVHRLALREACDSGPGQQSQKIKFLCSLRARDICIAINSYPDFDQLLTQSNRHLYHRNMWFKFFDDIVVSCLPKSIPYDVIRTHILPFVFTPRPIDN